jgi:hypothetical protein
MMAVGLLYVLATLDAAMSGYRAAGGRNARINKSAYQTRAQFRGAVWGQAGILAIAAVVALSLATDTEPPSLAVDLLEGCRRGLVVYVPYALVFVAALLLRVVPSVDVRSILNVLVFGPFTLFRPFIGLAGVAWAFVGVPRWQVCGIGVFGIAVMLGLECALDRWCARKNFGSRSAGGGHLPDLVSWQA